MKRLEEDQILEIIKLYQDGMTPKDIGNKFGIMNNSVTRILRKRNVDRNQLERVSEENIKIIIDRYNNGTSSEIIAKDLNIDGGTVCRILKRNNIEIRPSTENKRKYNIDQNFFETIDTEAKAYFLGFLYADGFLRKNGSSIRLLLHSKDRHILESFSNLIYGFSKIRESFNSEEQNPTIYCAVLIHSIKMHSDLCKLGCTPKKSFTITFPSYEIVSENLMRHFIRGFMDGDGCISIRKDLLPLVDFTSTEQFLQELQKYFQEKLEIDPPFKLGRRHLDRDTNTRNLRYYGAKAKRVLDYLYDGATLYLDRKKKKYDEIVKIYNKNEGK